MELVVIRHNVDHSRTHSIYSEDQIERPPLSINVELYHKISLEEAVRELAQYDELRVSPCWEMRIVWGHIVGIEHGQWAMLAHA